MSMLQFAKDELDRIGMTEDSDEYNAMGRAAILQMVELFSNQGHSGVTAPYCINALSKLLMWEPLSPLTGDDSEWMEVDEDGLCQNVRCSHVFKRADGSAYDINGRVFWDLATPDPTEDDPDPVPFKSYFTCIDSHTPVTFPYTPTTVYQERIPNEPA